MELPEYRHYFCQLCGDRKRSTLTAPGIQIQWESVPGSMFKCGEWSDKGTIKPGPGCRANATVELIAIGGNPVTSTKNDARPILNALPPTISG